MIFPGKYESLPAISAFVTQFARELGFDEDAVYAVELAVDEACTNIIEHAYKHDDGTIVCSCAELKKGIKITLEDQGKTFDPLEVPEPDPSLPLEKVSPRGAGLFDAQDDGRSALRVRPRKRQRPDDGQAHFLTVHCVRWLPQTGQYMGLIGKTPPFQRR